MNVIVGKEPKEKNAPNKPKVSGKVGGRIRKKEGKDHHKGAKKSGVQLFKKKKRKKEEKESPA